MLLFQKVKLGKKKEDQDHPEQHHRDERLPRSPERHRISGRGGAPTEPSLRAPLSQAERLLAVAEAKLSASEAQRKELPTQLTWMETQITTAEEESKGLSEKI